MTESFGVECAPNGVECQASGVGCRFWRFWGTKVREGVYQSVSGGKDQLWRIRGKRIKKKENINTLIYMSFFFSMGSRGSTVRTKLPPRFLIDLSRQVCTGLYIPDDFLTRDFGLQTLHIRTNLPTQINWNSDFRLCASAEVPTAHCLIFSQLID
jgi:hypothetical protein